MKILQINSAKNFGGGEKHFVDLIKGLRAQEDEIFIAVRPNALWLEALNFISNKAILLLPLKNSFDLKSAWQLAQFIKRERIDIVHAHLARDYAIAALAVRLSQTTAKLILTRHVLFKLNRFYKFLLPPKTVFIAVSRAVQENLRQQKLVSKQNVRLVLNGVDTKHFQTTKNKFDRNAFNKQFKLSQENLVVGVVGEITAHKGQTEFVQAIALLAREQPQIKAIIVGRDGSSQKQHLRNLENLIKKLDLTEKILFSGWVADAAPILAGLDVFVSSSRVEPFGLVIVEAMAAGCAVVATETAGAVEIIVDNETGRLVPVGNVEALTKAIGELLADSKKRDCFGAKAQKAAAEKFDLSRMVAETKQIYQEVCE